MTAHDARNWLLASLLTAGLGACSGFRDDDTTNNQPDTATGTADVNQDPLAGKGVGETCNAGAVPSDCRFGLRCVEAACAPVGDTVADSPCVLTDECGAGLYCGVGGVCAQGGAAALNEACAWTADCEAGLVCASTGLYGVCAEAGGGDLDAPCVGNGDCLAGLACDAAGVCAQTSPVLGFMPWTGRACAPEDLEGPARVYAEVPSTADPDAEFFRLPFPNDIRVGADSAGGTLDLTGFPRPGPSILGLDAVDRIVDAIEQTQRGASSTPTIYFRFSRRVTLSSVWAPGINNPPPGEPTLYLVDITPESPRYNASPAFGYFVTDGGGRYICPNYVAIHPDWNGPFEPGTTYAAILADGIRTSEDDTALVADGDMVALLSASAPADDPALQSAWEKYAPLRAYLEDPEAKVTASRVIAAAVFTVQPMRDALPAIREAVRAQPAPAPSAIVRCDATTTSPCDDGLTGEDHVRGCFGESGAAHELHLKVPVPMVQRGTRPYLDPSDGGGLARAADGSVTLQGAEDVCVSVTIPKGATMPGDGWPLVLYGHGTGGHFRGGVGALGFDLATYDVGDGGASVSMALAAWDGVMHGSRRGGVDLAPDGLFFNLANPLAALGNVYQGAADLFAMVQAFEALSIAAADSPTGEDIRFDAARFAYVGHSQGSQTAAPALAFEPGVGAIVFSGAGAGLILSLLNKTEPVDARLAVALAVAELNPDLTTSIGDTHPVMTLAQGLFDPVDPLNLAALHLNQPPEGRTPQHVLHLFGIDDSFTPPATSAVFARRLGAPLATPVLDPIGGVEQVTPPLTGNLMRAGVPVTAAVVQGEGVGFDGHFIMFQDAEVKRQVTTFLATFARDGVPTIPAR